MAILSAKIFPLYGSIHSTNCKAWFVLRDQICIHSIHVLYIIYCARKDGSFHNAENLESGLEFKHNIFVECNSFSRTSKPQ